MVSYDRNPGFRNSGFTVSPTPDSGCNSSRYIQQGFTVASDQYRNLVATAKRVDMVLDKEKAISRKETKLREERTRLEAERKLPIKEQMELFKLRVLKNIVRR